MMNIAYIFRKITGRTDFADHFKMVNIRYKRTAYDINVKKT